MRRSKVYTWVPERSMFEDIQSIEKNLLWAEAVSEWDILVSLKQPQATGSTKGGVSGNNKGTLSILQQQLLQQQQQQQQGQPQVSPTYTVHFKDLSCVATAVKSARDFVDIGSIAIAPDDSSASVSSTSSSALRQQTRTTQWKCHGKKYYIRTPTAAAVGSYPICISLGSIDKGALTNVPVLEVAFCPASDDDVAVAREIGVNLDELLDVIAYELIPIKSLLSVSTFPISELPTTAATTTTAEVAEVSEKVPHRTAEEQDDVIRDLLVHELRVRTVRWIHAVSGSIITRKESINR